MDTAKSEDAVVLETQYLEAVPAVGVVEYRFEGRNRQISRSLGQPHLADKKKKKKKVRLQLQLSSAGLALGGLGGSRFTREMPRR